MTDRRNLYLVSTGWLADRLGDPGLRVLDVTAMLTRDLANLARERAFEQGHIPGAQFLDVGSAKGALSEPDGTLGWTWPTATRVEKAMRGVGVDNGTRVILYAGSPRPEIDKGAMWATRAWWILHHFGVNAAILNGGFEAWVAERHPISTETSLVAPGTFRATSDGLAGRATRDDVLAAGGSAACLIDALPEASFDGTTERPYGARPGHITGAVNLPMARLLEADRATFADAGTMAATFADAGIAIDRPVITYCGGGIAATLDAFALTLLGNDHVRVYDASLSEWGADDSLPMTNPAAG